MPNSQADGDHPGSPGQFVRRTLRGMWRDARSVYYANTVVWRLLKSAALVFLGLFCWVGANLVLSYRPEWWPVNYVLAYGFLLLFWGPLTHLVLIPLMVRLRRSGATGPAHWFTRHGTVANLSVFFALVFVLGFTLPGVLTFGVSLPAGDGGGDVNPLLQCTRSGETVHCHLSSGEGIDHVVVLSGGEELTRIDEPPYDFDVMVGETAEVSGDRQFTVELRDADGELLRRYVRRVQLIPG